MRSRGLVLAAVASGLLLSGCSVPVGAVAGIGVDAEGRPIAFVQVCQGQIDSMTLWQGEGDDVAARWTAAAPATEGGFATFLFPNPGPGWKADPPAYSGLDPKASYTLQGNGGQDQNAWSTQYVDFTAKTLRGLKPGQVRYWVGTNDSGTKDVFTVSTVEEFKASACKTVTGDG